MQRKLCAGALAVAIAVFLASCGSEENPFSQEQLPGFVNGLAAASGDQELIYQDISAREIPQQTSDTGLARGWLAARRLLQLAPAPGLERIMVTVELYDSTEAAERRHEGEAAAVGIQFERALGVAWDEFDASEAGDGCRGLSLEGAAIISQYQVHCRVETLFIWARVIGGETEMAIALTMEAAREVFQRAEAALAGG